MSALRHLAPPPLVPEKYDSWKKEMQLWEMATSVEKKKRAPTVFLSLTGKAREAVLEMDLEKLDAEEGMKALYEKLDSLFETDKNQAALMAYESFESYVRLSDMSVTDFLIEFDRLVAKLKDHAIVLPDAVIAYRSLKSANLSQEDERLVKATVADLKLESMSTQLKKIMKNVSSSSNNGHLAVEIKKEVNVAITEDDEKGAVGSHEGPEEVYYGRWSGGRFNNSNRRWRGGRSRRNWGARYQPSSWGTRSQDSSHVSGSKKTNPPGHDGRPSKCSICHSIYHWARKCPDADFAYKDSSEDLTRESNFVLLGEFDNIDDHTNKDRKNNDVSTLLGETIGAVVLDSGCSETVCGKTWYECFVDTLPQVVKDKLSIQKSTRTFKFGSGKLLPSLMKVFLPCFINGFRVDIVTHVVDSDIPLLLSKAAM